MGKLLIEEFKPSNLDEFIGNSEVVDSVKKWASDWKAGKNQKPLFFYGPVGTGKTLLASLIAREFEWPLLELNSSDFRSKAEIEKNVGAAALNQSFSSSHRLILIDEVDALSKVDLGGVGAIAKIIKESKNPVILTANDIYQDKKLAPLRTSCILTQFKKINYLSINNFFKKVLTEKGVKFDEEATKEIAKNCSGDIRAGLLDLQASITDNEVSMDSITVSNYREREENVFKVVHKLFASESFNESKKIITEANTDNNMLFLWLEENIPSVYSPKDTASAFDYLSKADVSQGRIMKRQHYGFLRYFYDSGLIASPLSKDEPYKGFFHLNFPSFLRRMSSSMSARKTRKSLALKIGKKIHESSSTVIDSLPLIRAFLNSKEKAASFSSHFDLDESELAFLLGIKEDSKKMKNILELKGN